MEVIKPSIYKRMYEVVCDNCDATLLFRGDEVSFYEDDHAVFSCFVECPECYTHLYMDVSDKGAAPHESFEVKK